MTIKEITTHLESIAPLTLQESYDNSGLLVGNPGTEVSKILVSLDVTEPVIEEAIEEGCNLIISHHPIIFRGLKKLTGKNYVERTVIKAIQNNIALYAIHTNLDNVFPGVNQMIARKLGLKNLRTLSPKEQTLKKLVTFIPVADSDAVLNALHITGAGAIGNYSECSFQVTGTGCFRPDNSANPAIGSRGELESVEENRVEVIFPAYLQRSLIQALLRTHPYEEPAFDIFSLDNPDTRIGAGMIGDVEEPIPEKDFLYQVKKNFNLQVIRHTPLRNKGIKKVAVCGGSGSFLLKTALAQKADIFITADFKYHEFFDAENEIVIADVGHYESEQFTKELIIELLIDKFSNIAVISGKTITNPIRYLL